MGKYPKGEKCGQDYKSDWFKRIYTPPQFFRFKFLKVSFNKN